MSLLGLRPFFCFYGGKWRCAPKHPAPSHDVIVEPFAGAAGYSLRYPDRDVRLFDLDPIVAGVWQYLIRVGPKEVLAIPDVGHDETVDDLAVCEEARWLVGFWLNKGVTSPRKSPSSWMRSGIRPGSFWGTRARETIASQLGRIRHWEISNRGYHFAGDTRATWFVDPPYQGAGKHYRFGANINYGHLAAWCKSRQGQVLVCENVGADWLPFAPWRDVKANEGKHGGKTSREALWAHDDTPTKEDRGDDR